MRRISTYIRKFNNLIWTRLLFITIFISSFSINALADEWAVNIPISPYNQESFLDSSGEDKAVILSSYNANKWSLWLSEINLSGQINWQKRIYSNNYYCLLYTSPSPRD